MASAQAKKRWIVSVIVVVLVVGLIAGVVIAKNIAEPNSQTPTVPAPQSTDVDTTDASTDSKDESSQPDAPAAPTVDPATLSSVDITPLAIKVFYTKGVAGFDFTVKRTADQTEYVEFSTAALVGTKCTNDQGSFASIIKNPTQTALQATTQTVKVGNDTYGLSLAGKDCTPDAALLEQYQTAFTNGFNSLTAL